MAKNRGGNDGSEKWIEKTLRLQLVYSIQWSLSLRFPHQDPIHPLSSPTRATCPAHLILLDFITRTILGEEYRWFSSSLCSLLHSPVTSSLLGTNIPLNTMFSNTLSSLSSCNASDQVSHPYKTTGNIIVLYILIVLHVSLWYFVWPQYVYCAACLKS